jgi:hypothetical protein
LTFVQLRRDELLQQSKNPIKYAHTGAIESQTSKIPSSGYFAAGFGAITASAILKIVGKDDWALFVGQWPAAFL